jgi:putative hemolysin
MKLFVLFLLTVVFLACTFCLTALSSAFRRMHKKDAIEQLNRLGKWFFYRPFHLHFFPQHEYEGLFFATIVAQNISRFCYAATILMFLSHTDLFHNAITAAESSAPYDFTWLWLILSLLAFIIIAFVVADYLPRIMGTRFPEMSLQICAPLSSPFLFLVFPLTYVFLKASQTLNKGVYLDPSYEPVDKEDIMDMLQRADLSPSFEAHEKKLIQSVVNFKERIAREVMVPRVDVFSFSAETSIREAAQVLEKEGYSRTPVYRNTVDNIVGVLMYKDVLAKYMEYEQKGNDLKVLNAPIETIMKGVLHTPESKKLSSLLQEFRKKQVHLAIVVDEYGGTEGIVTIEDILEEIVGEISDEYDLEEQEFWPQPGGGWVVDARMNILDAEEDLGIKFPQEGEYDTIGGYIFHITGSIPSKGFVIHLDKYDMEILESNDRVVEKVRIRPISNNPKREKSSQNTNA